MPEEAAPQILVAGVGNTWLSDDGFGSKVVAGLEGSPDLPEGVTVLDSGTGGLDLAYELMRGYAALVLVDVSKQGGEPGTLYLIEPDPEEFKPITDGEVINPHGMDPRSVLRFVKTVGGWPGKVVIVACEPTEVEEMSLELSPVVEAAVEGARALVLEQVTALSSAEAYEEAGADA